MPDLSILPTKNIQKLQTPPKPVAPPMPVFQQPMMPTAPAMPVPPQPITPNIQRPVPPDIQPLLDQKQLLEQNLMTLKQELLNRKQNLVNQIPQRRWVFKNGNWFFDSKKIL